MRVRLNGEEREVAPSLTVAELVEELQLSPRQVAVEVNRELVPRAQREATRLAEGDEIEVVTLVGGG